MPELDYQSSPPISRETSLAEKHLVVWSCLFFSASALVTLLTLWVIYKLIAEGALSSGDNLFWSGFLIAIPSGIAFFLWSLATRCMESRRALLRKDWAEFYWAVQAFNAIFAVCSVLFLISVLILGAFVYESRALHLLFVPGVFVLLGSLAAWTSHRVSRATRSPS